MAIMTKKVRCKDPEFLKAIRELACLACGRHPKSEAHHIKTKGAGGGDDFWNVIPLCTATCHVFGGKSWHNVGWREFCDIHPHVWEHLQSLGWSDSFGNLHNINDV